MEMEKCNSIPIHPSKELGLIVNINPIKIKTKQRHKFFFL